jgi:hypothetical protein
MHLNVAAHAQVSLQQPDHYATSWRIPGPDLTSDNVSGICSHARYFNYIQSQQPLARICTCQVLTAYVSFNIIWFLCLQLVSEWVILLTVTVAVHAQVSVWQRDHSSAFNSVPGPDCTPTAVRCRFAGLRWGINSGGHLTQHWHTLWAHNRHIQLQIVLLSKHACLPPSKDKAGCACIYSSQIPNGTLVCSNALNQLHHCYSLRAEREESLLHII